MATIRLPPSRAKLTKATGNGSKGDFKVRDLSLAEWGRKTIQVSEHEMPGLMAIRAKYGPSKPLQGVRITGSLHMTIETAILGSSNHNQWQQIINHDLIIIIIIIPINWITSKPNAVNIIDLDQYQYQSQLKLSTQQCVLESGL